MEIEFNRTEEKVLRDLKKKFVDKGEFEVWMLEQILNDCRIKHEQWNEVSARFLHLGILEKAPADPNIGYYIKSPVTEYVSQLDHKPPPNYWNEWLKLCFASRLLTAIFLIFLFIPAIANWLKSLIYLFSTLFTTE